MAAFPNSDSGGGLVHEPEQGKGTSPAQDDSGKRLANIERRQRLIEELGNNIQGSKTRHRRFRPGRLLRIAIPLAIINILVAAAAWLSISTAIEATNRATAKLIKEVDKSREQETLSILEGVQENNRNLLTQVEENRKVSQSIATMTSRSNGLIDTLTTIQQNETAAGVERQKLLESMQQLLLATGQQVQDVKKSTDDAATSAKNAEQIAKDRPNTVITKTKTRTVVKTVKPPTLFQKIFGGAPQTTTRRRRQ